MDTRITFDDAVKTKLAQMIQNSDHEKPMNRREMETFEYLYAADCFLVGGESVLEERLRGIPGGWRDYRLARTMMRKALQGIMDTLPGGQQSHIEDIRTKYTMQIRPKGITGSPKTFVMLDKDLLTLINGAMHGECSTCIKEGGEIRGCALRKILLNLCPPEAIDKYGCEYGRITLDTLTGKRGAK